MLKSLRSAKRLLTSLYQDTNSLFFTERLNSLGIEVRFKTVVGDCAEDLATALRESISRSPLVILTGGLGPTEDDLTRGVVSEVLHRPFREVPEIRRQIQERLARFGRPMAENNLRQAMVPEGAVWLENNHGTAPGIWIEHDHNIVVLLPGPPGEMEAMFDARLRASAGAGLTAAEDQDTGLQGCGPSRIRGG